MLLIKLGLIFLLLIAFVFLFSWLSKLPSIQIKNIEVEGNAIISKAEITDFIKKEISGEYFLLFSKKNFFLYPKGVIERKLADNFKRIEKIEIKSKGLNYLVVNLIERKPYSLWCDGGGNSDKIESASSEKCYFLDKNGFVFSEAPEFSGNTFFRYYGLLKEDNPVGGNYMESLKFKEIRGFVDSLKILGINSVKFHASSEDDYEIDLDNGGKIIFDDKQLLTKTLENLESVLDEIGLGKSSSTDSAVKLDYVDLRFGNKVFYKTKN